MTDIDIDVRGTPITQGSMKPYRLPDGKIAMRYAAAVYVWRGQVQQAVAQLDHDIITGPVKVMLKFQLLRPRGHYGTGRNADIVKASAPSWPAGGRRDDLDKLVRCILDAITDAGLWKDDAQVVILLADKRYVDERPGVRISVTPLSDS